MSLKIREEILNFDASFYFAVDKKRGAQSCRKIRRATDFHIRRIHKCCTVS